MLEEGSPGVPAGGGEKQRRKSYQQCRAQPVGRCRPMEHIDEIFADQRGFRQRRREGEDPIRRDSRIGRFTAQAFASRKRDILRR